MNDEQVKALAEGKALEIEAFQRSARRTGSPATGHEFLVLALEHMFFKGKNAGLEAARVSIAEAGEARRPTSGEHYRMKDGKPVSTRTGEELEL